MNRRRRRREISLSYGRRPGKSKIGLIKEIFSWLFLIIVSIALAVVLVYLFGIRTSVVGSSMEPTLSNGQEVMINSVAYQLAAPKRGDVIVFKPNGNKNAHYSIKRIIGIPGDTVQIKNGLVYINAAAYKGDVSDDTREAGIAADEIVLAADEYFVLGDNRMTTEDSRSANIGNVSRSMIEGKAWLALKHGDESMKLVK